MKKEFIDLTHPGPLLIAVHEQLFAGSGSYWMIVQSCSVAEIVSHLHVVAANILPELIPLGFIRLRSATGLQRQCAKKDPQTSHGLNP
jgi:hypothetical protein